MGVLLAFSRVMYLTRYMNDVEAQLLDVTEEKQHLMDKITKISDVGDLGDTDSAYVKELRAMKDKLKALDRKLDARMQELQTRLNAAKTELNSANQMLNSNIQSSFQINLGGRMS